MIQMRSRVENYILSLNKSKNTIDSYRRDLNQMCDFLETNSDRTPADYAAMIIQQRPASSAVRILASMNGFFRNEVINGNETTNPIEEIVPPHVEKKEKRKFDFNRMPSGYSAKSVRDRAMIAVQRDTDMKVTALLELKTGDVTELRLSSETKGILEDYIYGSRDCILNGNKTDRLFINMNGKSMSRQGFWKIMKEYGDYQNG